jgi:hypothetical protein
MPILSSRYSALYSIWRYFSKLPEFRCVELIDSVFVVMLDKQAEERWLEICTMRINFQTYVPCHIWLRNDWLDFHRTLHTLDCAAKNKWIKFEERNEQPIEKSNS